MKRCLMAITFALLAGTTSSWSDIIGVQNHYVLGTKFETEFLDLDLDGNGSIDFRLYAGGLSPASGIGRENQNRCLIQPAPPPNIGGTVAALNPGYIIGLDSGLDSSEEWFGLDGWDTLFQVFDTGIAGDFYQTRGYIGLEFEGDDGIHYGWLDVEGTTSSLEDHLIGNSSLIIHGWAYESAADESIAAGSIPEPSSVLLLTLGAIGLWTLRSNIPRDHPAHKPARKTE